MEKLEKILKKENIKYNESMKKHTTMKVGGEAKVLVEPESVEEIKQVIDFAKENNIAYYVIGKGSNLLVSDDGIDGIVIKISSKFSDIKVDGNTIYATSGASMPLVSITAKNNMLSGFEFACGIPGTIGGGVKMNAGAYGSEISNIVTEITYLDEDGSIKTIKNKDAKFGYRDSIFKQNDKLVILSAKFELEKKEENKEIEKIMSENNTSRRQKQPIELPNFGSVFKRPEGHFVGPMIIECGLQGYNVGDAQVSTKHAGFIVNLGNATCKDVEELIEIIKEKVYEKFNVHLETEVQFIGGKK